MFLCNVTRPHNFLFEVNLEGATRIFVQKKNLQVHSPSKSTHLLSEYVDFMHILVRNQPGIESSI